MKVLINIIFLITIVSSCQSQNLDKTLNEFLEKEESLEGGKLYTVDLFVNKKGKIVKFGILGSHQLPYIAISENQKVSIVQDYKAYSLIQETRSFLEDESESIQIEIIRKLLDVSEVHLKMEGWDVIEE